MIRCLGSQPRHDPREYSHVTPPFPTVVERLVRAIFLGRITPPQPIAINADNSAEQATVIPLGTLLRTTLTGSEHVGHHDSSENTVGAAPFGLRSASKDCS